MLHSVVHLLCSIEQFHLYSNNMNKKAFVTQCVERNVYAR
jgi:hypothetical protein